MPGMGLQGAAGAVGGFEGIRKWLADAQALQGITHGNEDRASAIQRQAMLDQRGGETHGLNMERGRQVIDLAAAGEGREVAELGREQEAAAAAGQDTAALAQQIDADPNLSQIQKLVFKASLRRGGSLPAGLLEQPKPPEPKLQFAPDGTVVDMRDPSLVGRSFGKPQQGPSEASQLAAEMARLRIDAEKQKQADATTQRTQEVGQAQETTQAALDSVRRLLDPAGVGGGLDSSYGNWEMRKGRTQASADFQAERDRFVAMLALPNLGKLKGAMSDNDLLFIKQISSKLSNDNISEDEARKEMRRAETFLASKLGGGAAGGGKTVTRAQLAKIAQKKGTDVQTQAARAAAQGYSVVD
jgi:hypothetical protein